MTFGSLYVEAQDYVPVLLENLHGMSCSGICWLLSGALFQCRYGGFWMSFCPLMVPGVRVFWCFQVLDLSLLPLAFSLTLIIASILLHPYSTVDKTSRLMVKRFFTVRDTQRDSQLRGEEKREEGDRGDQEEKRGSQKGREQSSQ